MKTAITVFIMIAWAVLSLHFATEYDDLVDDHKEVKAELAYTIGVLAETQEALAFYVAIVSEIQNKEK